MIIRLGEKPKKRKKPVYTRPGYYDNLRAKTGVNHPSVIKFLRAYEICGSIREAARIAAGRQQSPRSLEVMHHRRMKENAVYRRKFEMAKQIYCDVIREEIHNRAIEGIAKPVFYQGRICGEVIEKSDTLLMFHAKAKMPEYRDRQPVDGAGPQHLHLHNHDSRQVVIHIPDNGRSAPIKQDDAVVRCITVNEDAERAKDSA